MEALNFEDPNATRGRLIQLFWPEWNIRIVGRLADNANPELTEEFWSNLPFRSLWVHPVAGGEIMYAWAPIVSTAKAPVRLPVNRAPLGQIRYSAAGGNKFGIQYGSSAEPSVTPLLGYVTDAHLPLLRAIGQATWENLFWHKRPVFVEVSRFESAEEGSGPAFYKGDDPLFQKIARRTAEIQTEEPSDMTRLRQGQVDGGSYDQYFSVWQMAHSRLHDYAVGTLTSLIKLCPLMDAAAFRTVYTTMAPSLGYLGFLGFEELAGFEREISSKVMASDSTEEISEALNILLLYALRLCSWSYLYFPWYLGIFFGKTSTGGVLPGRISGDAYRGVAPRFMHPQPE